MLKQRLNIYSGLLLLSLIIGSATHAENTTTQQIHEDAVNLSATVFLKYFTSRDISERKSARLYLLGVLDATEGKSWCDFKTLKTISINEFLYEKMKNLPAKELDRRASVVIEELLHELAPCKER